MGKQAFDALMDRRNGEALPGPTCPHFSRDHEGKCWACVYDKREREMKAAAFNEGVIAQREATRASGGAVGQIVATNPYVLTHSADHTPRAEQGGES